MYTSRLPKSTSVVRRPTDGGSTSFVGLHRPSNIPVTVKKVNLFTPHTKRPFHGATSTAGKSFMSGLATDRKYQRPMPDKEQQVKMFNALVDFIKTKGPDLPVPEAKKFFSSVSTSESTRLFEFLIRFIVPDFKITRLEKDVPEVLETLDYPYIRSVTKSALVSVTTRQAAVGLLKIFFWLLGAIQQLDSNSDDGEDDLDEVAQIYECIYRQPERVQEGAQEVFESIYPHVDIDKKQAEQREIQEELENLLNEEEQTNNLLTVTKTLEEDIQKLYSYRDQLQLYYQTKQTEQVEQGQQSSKLDFQNEEKLKRLERLESAIQSHEVVESEAIKILTTYEELKAKENHSDLRINESKIELEHMDKKYQAATAKCTKAVGETTGEMDKLLKSLESYTHIGSDQLADRTQAVRDWVWRLEQLDHTDLEQVRDVDHKIDLFFQKLRAFSPALESELKDLLLDKKSQLENLELSNDKYSKDKKMVALETIDRQKKEDEVEDLQFREQLSKSKAQEDELERKLHKLKEDSARRLEEQSRELAGALERLKQERLNLTDFEKLNRDYQSTLCARNKQEIVRMVEQVRNDVERFKKALKIDEENNKLLRSFAERLKRKVVF